MAAVSRCTFLGDRVSSHVGVSKRRHLAWASMATILTFAVAAAQAEKLGSRSRSLPRGTLDGEDSELIDRVRRQDSISEPPSLMQTSMESAHSSARMLHRLIDADHSGTASTDEFMEYVKWSRERQLATEISEQLSEVDTDADDRVSLAELEAFAKREKLDPSVEKAKFFAADKDGNGYLAKSEMPPMLDPSLDDAVREAEARAESRAHFLMMDKDGNGKVSFAEIQSHEPAADAESAQDQKHAFSRYDLNRDGELTVEEMVELRRAVADQEGSMHLADLVGRVDQNSDGAVSLAELGKFAATEEGQTLQIAALEGHRSTLCEADKDVSLRLQNMKKDQRAWASLFPKSF